MYSFFSLVRLALGLTFFLYLFFFFSKYILIPLLVYFFIIRIIRLFGFKWNKIKKDNKEKVKNKNEDIIDGEFEEIE